MTPETSFPVQDDTRRKPLSEISPDLLEAAILRADKATVDRMLTRRYAAELFNVRFDPKDTRGVSDSEKIIAGMQKYLSQNTGIIAVELQKNITAVVLQNFLNAEMDAHLRYRKYSRTDSNGNKLSEKKLESEDISCLLEGSDGPADDRGRRKAKRNYRNGSYTRTVRTYVGDMTIDFPRDRNGTFESHILPSGNTDICGSREQIYRLAAMGHSVRDIAYIFETMLHCKVSQEYVQCVLEGYTSRRREWQKRELKALYPFIFIDCLSLHIRQAQSHVVPTEVYVILGIDMEGRKELLSIEITGKDENRSDWMNVFSGLQTRGLKDTLFVCMDGVKGIDAGVRAVFPNAITQWCMIHMVHGSTRFLPTGRRLEFCSDVKKIYGAPDLESARTALRGMENRWRDIAPLAVNVWTDNFDEHVAPLFDFPLQIRKLIYTTNAVETVNSSFKQVVKKGCYHSDEGALNAMLLRSDKVLSNNWQSRSIRNWPVILNQLLLHERTSEVVSRYQPR